MISVALAQQLRDVGLRWKPASGDRFIIRGRGMDDDVFVLSQMTIEVHEHPSGPIIKFNGTTEWALDSLSQDEVLWLPSEDQLRTALGATFRRLERVEAAHRVEVAAVAGDGAKTFAHEDAAEAYGLALLDLLNRLA